MSAARRRRSGFPLAAAFLPACADDRGVTLSGPAMAVQYNNLPVVYTDVCHRLSGPAVTGNIAMTLIGACARACACAVCVRGRTAAL